MTLTKQEARILAAQVIQRRNHQTYVEKSELVRNRVRLLLDSFTSGRVLLYIADKNVHEVDLSGFSDSFSQLSFAYVENSPSAPFPEGQYDFIFVPLYGFTAEGYRLGRGAGWYDRFLATQPNATLYGIGFEDTLFDFDTEPHDIRLNTIITERATY